MSTTTTCLSSYRLENLHRSTRNRSHSSVHNAFSISWISTAKDGFCNSTRQHVHSFNINRRGRSNRTARMDLISAVDNLPPSSSGSPFPEWSNWMLLTVIPMIIPFFSNKWAPLIAIKNKLNSSLQTVEDIAETVEEVARRVDKMADEMTEKLPEGSKLRQAIEMIDDVAEETIKAADCAEDILQKVEDAQNKLETMIKESEAKKAGGATTKVSEVK